MTALQMTRRHTLSAASAVLAAQGVSGSAAFALAGPANARTAANPFGAGWFFLYGYFGVPALPFMPELRSLGAGRSKVYLFWQQIEPKKGQFDFSAVDAYANQLKSPEEGLISIFSSSTWAGDKPSALLPPGPARNLDDYYAFVRATVARCKGKVRYWQNDCEPNNPIYWSGTAGQFVEQLKVFYRAVKDADPDAVVICGGYDGIFTPPGLTPLPGQWLQPMPGQEKGLAFFDQVLKDGSAAFDLFDLRLYGDVYTIPARLQYMRQRMRAFGYEKPIVCTEYGGPNFYEFAPNRKYLPLITAWLQQTAQHGPSGAPSSPIAELYKDMASLPPQTAMFLQGCPPELEAKYQRIQSRSLVARNLVGLAAGAPWMLYWQMLQAPGPRNDMMTLMYGKIGLVSIDNGQPKRTPTADAFARMAAAMAGVRKVERIELPGRPTIFAFRVDRGARGPLWVVWEAREQFSGEDQPPIEVALPWAARGARAQDIFGAAGKAAVAGRELRLSVTDTPLYVEAA